MTDHIDDGWRTAFNESFAGVCPDIAADCRFSFLGHPRTSIVCRTPALKPPFHRGMIIAESFGDSPSAIGRIAARNLQAHITRHQEAVAILRRQIEEVKRLTAGTGMTAGVVIPISISQEHKELQLQSRVEIDLFDNELERRQQTFLIGAGYRGMMGWNQLKLEARAQPNRIAQARKEFIVDAVFGHYLAQMEERDRIALAELLARYPAPSEEEDTGKALFPQWTHRRLLRRGLRLPKEIEILRVRNGRLMGRVRLSPKTVWNGMLLIARNAHTPATLASGIEGRKAVEVIAHPALADAGCVSEAKVTPHGDLCCRIETTSLSFPLMAPA